jgi:hypothetical protein
MGEKVEKKVKISVIPTSSTLLEGKISVELWKDSDTLAKSTTSKSYAGRSDGECYGNGTSHEIPVYAIIDDSGSGGAAETAQLK